MKAAVFPYKRTSESAKLLSEYLEGRLVPDIEDVREDEILINWGGGFLSSRRWKSAWLNNPRSVEKAVYKTVAFRLFERNNVRHPDWTTSTDKVKEWLEQGHVVLARQTEHGAMGEGISILNNPRNPIPTATFYSKHLNHDDEYRIHVFRDMVVNIGKKFSDTSNANRLVRNWGPWKFHNPPTAPEPVLKAGVEAVKALDLDFGSVDIGYCFNVNKAYVFEVNTAPGAGHNTITRYAKAFINHHLRRL